MKELIHKTEDTGITRNLQLQVITTPKLKEQNIWHHHQSSRSVQCTRMTAGCHAPADRDAAADRNTGKPRTRTRASTLHFPTMHLLFSPAFLVGLCPWQPTVLEPGKSNHQCQIPKTWKVRHWDSRRILRWTAFCIWDSLRDALMPQTDRQTEGSTVGLEGEFLIHFRE